MDLPLRNRSIDELCADGRTVPVPAGGMYLHAGAQKAQGLQGLQDDPYLKEAHDRPPMPGMTPLSYGPGDLASALTARFLDRLPLAALHPMVNIPLPSLYPALDLAGLGELTENGLSAEIPTADLIEMRPGRELPLAQHRVTWRDENRNTTTRRNAVTVQVASLHDRSAGVFDDLDDETAALADQLPYLSGRIVYGPDSVNLGRAGGLVKREFGALLAPFGRWRDNGGAARAAGATTITLDGYADLMHRMEWAPLNSQGLVQVEDESGAVEVFLAHRDGKGVAFLDFGAAGAARFPREPGPVRFTGLPGAMSLADRITALRDAGTAEVREPLPVKLPAGAEIYTPASGGSPAHPVVVLGGVDTETTATLEKLSGFARQLGRPVVVVGADGARKVMAEHFLPLQSLIVQFGWNGVVPIAYTKAMLKDDSAGRTVSDQLDGLRASIIHQITPGMAKAAGAPVAAFLDNMWTVRPPAGKGDGSAADAAPVLPSLTEPLFEYAAEQNDKPVNGRPPAEVTSLLHSSLKAFAGPTPPVDLNSPRVRKLSPVVTQIASMAPEFRPHSAVLKLTLTAGPEMVSSYVAAPKKDGRQKLFDAMLKVPGETPAARKAGVQEMMPHLAALSGADSIQDAASNVVLNAIMDHFTKARDDDTIRADIFQHRVDLAKDIKTDYVRLISQLKAKQPAEDGAGFDQVAQWLLDCPEPE
jgi:hypothetical protein